MKLPRAVFPSVSALRSSSEEPGLWQQTAVELAKLSQPSETPRIPVEEVAQAIRGMNTEAPAAPEKPSVPYVLPDDPELAEIELKWEERP